MMTRLEAIEYAEQQVIDHVSFYRSMEERSGSGAQQAAALEVATQWATILSALGTLFPGQSR